MEFKEVVKQRYDCKEFSSKKISESKLDELKEIIRMSPSSSNLQPWRIKVVNDDKTKRKLAEYSSGNETQILTCSHLLIFCADISLESRAEQLFRLMKREGSDVSRAKAFTDSTKRMVSSWSTSKKLSWASRQTFIPLSNSINGAKSLGFDSSPMEGFSAKDYHRILGLSNNLIPVVIVAIGYSASKARPKIRFSGRDVFI